MIPIYPVSFILAIIFHAFYRARSNPPSPVGNPETTQRSAEVEPYRDRLLACTMAIMGVVGFQWQLVKLQSCIFNFIINLALPLAREFQTSVA